VREAQLERVAGREVSGEFGEAVHRETEGNRSSSKKSEALIEQGSVKRESGRNVAMSATW